MNKPNWKAFNTRNLRLRVVSALIMLPFVLTAVYFGGFPYIALIAVTAVLGLHEWRRMVDPLTPRGISYASDGALLLSLACAAFFDPLLGVFVLIVATFVVFFSAALHQTTHARWRSARWIAVGLPYLGGCGLAFLYVRTLPAGIEKTFYILFVVWGTDVGAYLAGRVIGGPKLAPVVSPNKTWAGLGGGMVLAAACGYGVAEAFASPQPGEVAICASILAVISQIGDLFESVVKRRSGVKESGHLIPGHGGILDRIDGLIFAVITFALFFITGGSDLVWW